MSRDFPGTDNSGLIIGDAAPIDITGTALTVVAWVRPDNHDSDDNVVGKRADGASGVQYQLGMANPGGKVLFQIGDSGGADVAMGVTTIPTGSWSHIAGRKNGTGSGAIRVFLNGVDDNNATSNRTIQNRSDNLWIGENSPGGWSSVDGLLAEVAIWNIALTNAELAALARGVSPQLIKRANLRGYWPLFGTASPEVDYSGGGSHATVDGTVPAGASHAPVMPFVVPTLVPTDFVSLTDTTDSATVLVDLQASGSELAERVESATIYLDLQSSGTDELTTPVDYTDADTVYLDLRTYGVEEGVFYETFESLDAWDLSQGGGLANLYQLRNLYISRKHACDGPTSLRCNYATSYGEGSYYGGGFFAQWIDTVNGGDTTKTYWLSYSFYLEDWARIWRDGLGGGGNEAFLGVCVLPGFAHTNTYDDYGAGPTLQAIDKDSGEIRWGAPFGANDSQALTAGAWHTVKMRVQDDGVNVDAELWIDGVSVGSDVSSSFYPNPPMGVDIYQTQSRAGGVVYIDDLIYSPNAEPRGTSAIESGDGTTTQQWIKLRDKYSGTSAVASIELDPDADGDVPEAWLYAAIYIPQTLLDAIPNFGQTNAIFESDTISDSGVVLAIHKTGGVCEWRQTNHTPFAPAVAGWNRLAIHYVQGQTQYELILNDTLYNVWVASGHTAVLGPITNIAVWYPMGRDGSTPYYENRSWIGLGEFAVSLSNWVREDNYDFRFPIQDVEAADIFYVPSGPTDPPSYPPYWAARGPEDDVVSLEEGYPAPSPTLPFAESGDQQTVYLDLQASGVDVASTTVDAATVPMWVRALSSDVYSYTDAGTVYLELTSLGGECHSTWSSDFLGEGDAFVVITGDAQASMFGDAEADWTMGEISKGDTVNC